MRTKLSLALLLALLSSIALAASAVGSHCSEDNCETFSDTYHPYDLYYGTVTYTHEGGSSPFHSRDGFAMEVRISEEGAGQLRAALPDLRIAQGLAAPAPDGGSYITSMAAPDWWERPGGPTAPINEPIFADAESRFLATLATPPPGGGTMTCSETRDTYPLRDPTDNAEWEMPPTILQFPQEFPAFASLEETLGPETIWVGQQRRTEEVVPAGTLNTNTNISYFILTAHRIDRTCVVARADTPPRPDSPQVVSADPGRMTPGNCPDANGPTQADLDGDGIGDPCDEDPSLPDSCALRKARARIFVPNSGPKVRLVVRYRTQKRAQVTTEYSAKLLAGGWLTIGKVTQKFAKEGIFRLPKELERRALSKVRAAETFRVRFSIPGTPADCARFYTKTLNVEQKVAGQSIFFQSDSVFAGF